MNILRSTLLSAATVVALAFTSVPLANATEPNVLTIENTSRLQSPPTSLSLNVTSASDVKISFSSPSISSKPAPLPEPTPAVLAQEVAPITTQEALQPAVAAPAPVVEAPAPAPVVQEAPAPVAQEVRQAPVSGVGGALVSSAYAQLGISQDCTAMVENALGSIGIITGDIAPEHFYRYGQVVSDPQPGDLMIRPGHVAIYVGNGMAISGGFNNFQTVLHPSSYLGGSTFVRVG